MSVHIHWYDVHQLAVAMLELSEDATAEEVEDALFEKFEVSFDNFAAIVAKLAPFTIPSKSPLTGEWYQGFVKDGGFIVAIPHEKG